MRAFFAIKPAPEICLAIDSWRQRNWPLLEKPVPVANFHITLAFLSEVNDAQLAYLLEAADTIKTPGFELTLDQVGYWHKPALLWLGPSDSPQELTTLAAELKQLARNCKLPTDKKAYKPHLSLARKVHEAPPAAIDEPSFQLRCGEFTLFESDTRPSGAIYREVASWPLSKP